MLPPAKTNDAIIVAPAPVAPATEARFAVYDGNGYMTNPSDPLNEAVGDSVGGMLRFLAFGPAGPANTVPVVTAPTPDPLAVTAQLCRTSVPATDPAIAAWLALAIATDAEDGTLPTPTNDAPLDFPIGSTLVTFTATDSASAVGTATATVLIAETPNTAPSVTAPGPLTINVASGTTSVPATDAAIAAWLGSAVGSDTQDGPLTPTTNAPASFPAALAPGATTTVTFTATDACGLTSTASSTLTVVAAPAVNQVQLYLSFASNTTLNTVLYGDEDILSWNGSAYALVFDGSDVGLGNADIDAFSVVDANTVLISFDAPQTAGSLTGIPGSAGPIDDSDIVRFTGNLGPATSGTFSLYFDASDVGLTEDSEDVDAVEAVPGGLLVSIVGNNQAVTGVSGVQDEDLLLCSSFTTVVGGTAGVTTACTWSLYFDGSDVGLNNSDNEDIDGAALSGNQLYLTTLGGYTVTGSTGDGNDVFVCSGPTTVVGGSQGVTTSCSQGFTTPVFNFGVGNVDAIDLP